MKKIYNFTGLLFATMLISTVYSQPCVDGFSGDYPCDKIDQMSMMPLSMFFSQNANDVWGWTNPATGREFVAFGLADKTAFVDITSPAYPLYIGYLPTATIPSLWRDMKVIDGYVFVGAEATNHGLQVFDMRRLENVSAADAPFEFDEDATYTGFGNSHNIVADEASGFIYAVGTSTFSGGLHIVDVNDPLDPSYAGSSDEDGYTHDAQVVVYQGPDVAYQGQQICFASNGDAMTIFDVTDKNNVNLIATESYDLVGYTHQSWLTEDHRYLLTGDETDEQNFGITTRTIIWDVQDLDNPVVIGYHDHGTNSIDHNLYIKENLVYLSNYTAGLHIVDLNDVAEGELNPFGYFDVIPANDNAQFVGSWSNYPYFESGVVPTTSMYAGLHMLKPQLFTLSEVIKVCDGSTSAGATINIEMPIDGMVNFALEMQVPSGMSASVLFSEIDGTPAQNQLVFQGLTNVEPGYYPGEVIITYGDKVVRRPFVLILDAPNDAIPELLAPIDGAAWPTQNVSFTYSDAYAGYALLQVALDENFDEIVYEAAHYSAVPVINAVVPFDETTYYWRLIKPDGCDDDIISATQTFIIDEVSSTRSASQDLFSLHPNPATDFVFISVNEPGIKILDVYDISGRKVAQWNMQQADAGQFDLNGFTPGMYIVKAQGAGKGQKFIKR